MAAKSMRLGNQSATVDLGRVGEIGTKVRQMVDELSFIFPERLHLINQIVFALLTQEHVLVFGLHGTGKSDLIHTLFGVFSGAKKFSIGLSKFMSEANIVGIPDPKKMREDGEVRYRRDGGILDADFAELDELFDSNPPLLRVLLGILNERQFKRGRQVEDAKLHTAIACTNGEPEEEIKKHPELQAVVDRFLFLCQVKWLDNPESRRRMYEKFLSGECPTVSIPLSDLKYLSQIVVRANQVSDPQFIAVFDRVVEEYLKKVNKKISDRRKCKLLQLVEAQALLYGRYDVAYEDLMAIRWGLCMGTNDADHEPFKAVAGPIIEKAVKEAAQSLDEIQLKLLGAYEAEVPAIAKQCDEAELVKLARLFSGLKKKVGDIRPQLPSTEDRKRRLAETIAVKAEEVRVLIEKTS